jgi:hypothetical protein
MNLPIEFREKAIGDWVNACHVNPDKVKYPPTISSFKKQNLKSGDKT